MDSDRTASLRDRLPLVAALVLSAVWILIAVTYIRGLPGGMRGLLPAELAGLLAGVGGPLAAFWLLMMVVQQQRRLTLMTRAMGDIMRQHRHTLQIAETQTRALMELQVQAKRAQASETRKLALQDMASNAAMLAERLGVIRREDMDITWARFGSGDSAAFVQPFLNFAATHPEISARLAEAVARDSAAAAALHSFVRRYEQVASDAGDDRLTRDIIEEGALGRAFRLFKAADGNVVNSNGAEDYNGPADDALQSRLANLSERLDASAPKH